MNSNDRFKIIFVKLAEAAAEEERTNSDDAHGTSVQELEEIDELRRLSLALREPEQASYTTT